MLIQIEDEAWIKLLLKQSEAYKEANGNGRDEKPEFSIDNSSFICLFSLLRLKLHIWVRIRIRIRVQMELRFFSIAHLLPPRILFLAHLSLFSPRIIVVILNWPIYVGWIAKVASLRNNYKFNQGTLNVCLHFSSVVPPFVCFIQQAAASILLLVVSLFHPWIELSNEKHTSTAHVLSGLEGILKNRATERYDSDSISRTRYVCCCCCVNCAAASLFQAEKVP